MHKFCKRRETQRIETKSCEMSAGKSVLKTWHSQIIYNTPGSVCRGCLVCVCVWCAWCVCYLLIKHESELSWAVLPVPGAFHQLNRTELNWAQNPQQTNKPMFSIAKQKSIYQPSPPYATPLSRNVLAKKQSWNALRSEMRFRFVCNEIDSACCLVSFSISNYNVDSIMTRIVQQLERVRKKKREK